MGWFCLGMARGMRAGAEPFERLAEKAARGSAWAAAGPVSLAFLELMEPDLAFGCGLRKLAPKGVMLLPLCRFSLGKVGMCGGICLQ